MSYKEKALKKRLLRQSLTDVVKFAFSEPQLPLKNRQAIVAAITLGGSLANRYKHFKLVPSYHLNYQYTRLGLIRACADKMINSPETQKVKKAICVISSLSAWAHDSPNLSQDILDDFIQEIVPEDMNKDEYLSASKVISNLKKEAGNDVPLDLITLSGNFFYKKYQGR